MASSFTKMIDMTESISSPKPLAGTATTNDPQNAILLYLNDISKRLAKNNQLLSKIYDELNSEADEGEYLIIEKTATASVDTIYLRDLVGHPIKSYSIENTGAVDINVGHNIDISKRYSTISASTTITFSFNRKKIRSIYVNTSSGTSTYKLILMW